jgi:hypothetical protein
LTDRAAAEKKYDLFLRFVNDFHGVGGYPGLCRNGIKKNRTIAGGQALQTNWKLQTASPMAIAPMAVRPLERSITRHRLDERQGRFAWLCGVINISLDTAKP